jgi:hypothetical protein
MREYFNRYSKFENDGDIKPIPGITLKPKSSDKRIIYKLGTTRLDRISQEYYGSPFYGWMILMANPQFGGLEWQIPDGQIIRIPFPFAESIEQYMNELDKNITLYGK